MKDMKKVIILFLALSMSFITIAQNSSEKARTLLDEVSAKMGAYENMYIGFTSTLVNKDAELTDDPPIRGNITLKGEHYNLNYLGNNFIFDGKKLFVINHERKEVNITDGNLEEEEEDGFIYPSKLLTFYKEGYTFSMGKLQNVRGRKIQLVNLTPIDSESAIVKVQLGIDAKSKHIYNLKQEGANGSVTTFTITTFKSNQSISKNLFSFDQNKYEKQGYSID